MTVIDEAVQIAVPAASVPLRVAGWLKRDLWRLGCIVALVAVAGQQVRIEGLTVRPHIGALGFTLIDWPGWRPHAEAAERALADQAKAEKQAHAAQVAENHKPAAISAAAAETINAQANAEAARVEAAVAAYARAHPVPVCLRGAGASELLASPAGEGGADYPAGRRDGQDVSSGLVAISRADLDGFAGNTRDLDAIRAYLATLIAKGVAVPSNKPN